MDENNVPISTQKQIQWELNLARNDKATHLIINMDPI